MDQTAPSFRHGFIRTSSLIREFEFRHSSFSPAGILIKNGGRPRGLNGEKLSILNSLATDKLEAYEKTNRFQNTVALNQIGTTSDSLRYSIHDNPLQAQLTGLRGQGRGEILQLDKSDPQFGERRDAINKRLVLQERLAVKENAINHDAIGLSQTTRQNQLDRLLARDPTGAAIAGLVGSTHAEQQRLYNSGFKDLAAKQGDLGLKELKLEKQNYLDGFRGQEFDVQHLSINNPRDTEDPAEVLKEFKNAKNKIKDFTDDIYDMGKGNPEDAAGNGGEKDEKLASIDQGIKDLLTAINALADA